MTMTPRVSLCVPTYNGAAYLAECLESILAQTVEDVEILIVDDCSQDETLTIAQDYQRRDSRIRVEANPQNLGLVGNWNRCIQRARGEWIKFVFQDDRLDPTCLEQMMAVTQQAPGCLLVYCRRQFLLDPALPEANRLWFEKHARFVDRVFEGETVVSPQQYGEAVLAHFGWNLLGEPTSVLLHRHAFLRFGLFNPHYVHNCDLEYWHRVACHTGALYVPTPLAWFRVHASSTSAQNYQHRFYRARVLDLLIMRHDLILSPLYYPLRQIATQQGSTPGSLKRLRVHARRAWVEAQTDPDRLRDWQQITHYYPLLAELSRWSLPEIGLEYTARKLRALRHRWMQISSDAPGIPSGLPAVPLEDDPISTS